MEKIRLQKFVSQLGLASRREAERWIEEGRLRVNSTVATLGTSIELGSDKVFLDGKPLHEENKPNLVYLMLYKPDMVVTSRVDGFNRETVFELPKLKKWKHHLLSVGRLDFRTEGLLLITNDGLLSHKLCHPKYAVKRTYQVLVNGRLTPEEERGIRKGIKLEDGTVEADIKFLDGINLGASKGAWYSISVKEGRNRVIRRIFETLGFKVVKLIRVAFGPLRLDMDMKPGDLRALSSDEIGALKLLVSMDSSTLESH